MKKNKMIIKIAILMLLTCPFASVKGQHRIVTVQNDTIHCRILSVKQSHIHYEQSKDGRVVGKFIPLEQIQEYSRGREIGAKPARAVTTVSRENRQPRQRWQIGIHGGGAYLIASTAADEKSMQQEIGVSEAQAKEYSRKLRNGIFAGGDIHYMFNDRIGVGANYSLFVSSVEMEFAARENAYSSVYYLMKEKEKVYVNYVGPSVVFRQPFGSNRKFALSEEITLGGAFLRDEIRFDPMLAFSSGNVRVLPNMLMESVSFGLGARLAFEYYMCSWLSIGANIGCFSAVFDEVTFSAANGTIETELEKGERLNFARIDYSIGFRAHF